MKLRIPTKIKLGRYVIPVRWDHKKCQEAQAAGYFSGSELVIYLDPKEPKQTHAETFLHEVFEAMNGIFGLELPHPTLQTLGVLLDQVIHDIK